MNDMRLVQLFGYTWKFYMRKLPQLLVFSVPLLIGFLIPFLVPAPTFISLGAVVLRTGSLPELNVADIGVTAIAYFISLFIIADAIANINLLIKSERTRTTLSSAVWTALTTYAVRILYVYTIMLLLFAIFQLATFEQPFQTVLYPILVFLLSGLFFFVAPALVIDNVPVGHAIVHSMRLALRKPALFLVWCIVGLGLVSVIRWVAGAVIPDVAAPLTLVLNTLFILPYLIILQTQMYMEKYPMAH